MDPPVIVPTKLLDDFCIEDLVQVCYASVALKDWKYLDFYKERVRLGKVVILDHSPGYPRSSVKDDLFLSIIRRLNPKVIVLPDSDLNWEKTVRRSLSFSRRVNCLTVGVLQGRDLESIEKCYKELKGKVSAVGLPPSVQKFIDRNLLIDELGILEPCILIETYKSVIDEKPKNPRIDIAWSTWPYRLAAAGMTLSETRPVPPSLDFDGLVVPTLFERNITRYKAAYKGNYGRHPSKTPV